MTEGRYLYCILDGAETRNLGKVGIQGGEVRVLPYESVGAVISPVPFSEIESNLGNILVHQKVVDLARGIGTALPVRFGIIFKTEEGVKKMLSKSYESYRTKLHKLKDRDEFGVKVILNDSGLKRIRESVAAHSEEVVATRKKLPKSGRGTSYLLRLKMEEAIKNQLYKKIEDLSQQIYTRLGAPADERTVLKSDHEQIILNAAYLINRREVERFQKEVEAVRKDFGGEGLIVHTSGPWAPYSFC